MSCATTPGTKRKLSALQGADPMVLVLSRGAFCPKDREQHRLLVEMEPELKVAYTKIVTISTDAMMEANEMRDGLGAHWPFLIDPQRTVQRDLDIAEYTDPHHNPMIPYTLVLEPGLVVYSVYNGYLTQPLLIVHGEHDTGFPVTEAEATFAAAASKDKTLRIFTIEEGGSEHVNADDPDPARQLIADWFAQRLGTMPKPPA
jgi:peroxiredoxin